MTTPQSPTNVQTVNRTFEEREAAEYAEKLGLEYLDLAAFPPNTDLLNIFSYDEALGHQVFPLSKSGKSLRVACVDPEHETTKAFLETLAKKYDIIPLVCSRRGMQDALPFYHSELAQRKVVEVEESTREDRKTFEKTLNELRDLGSVLSSMTAQESLGKIKLAAVSVRASDIHIQPGEKGATLRLRIDGVLHDVFEMDADIAQKITNQIKYEAGMRVNVTDTPQDGHATFIANDRVIDLRVSTLPTPLFESVVMRVLDARKGIQSFSELGFTDDIESTIHHALQKSTGMVLVTGPTGCGKTTTLYSMLAELNGKERKLVTLEDPIEYHLPGVSQSQVDEGADYNFENGLKALLRHDPDVMLVGEIRTLHTAKLAAEAALTGHVVLSSLHTNSAVGALARLRNLGLEDFNIAPTLNAIFAQRLVRKVCPQCAQGFALPETPEVKNALKRILHIFPETVVSQKIMAAKGCEHCSGTGYSGRTAVCEAFPVTDKIKKMILDHASDIEITDHLVNETTFLSLFESGMRKVLAGETTLDEVMRVVG